MKELKELISGLRNDLVALKKALVQEGYVKKLADQLGSENSSSPPALFHSIEQLRSSLATLERRLDEVAGESAQRLKLSVESLRNEIRPFISSPPRATKMDTFMLNRRLTTMDRKISTQSQTLEDIIDMLSGSTGRMVASHVAFSPCLATVSDVSLKIGDTLKKMLLNKDIKDLIEDVDKGKKQQKKVHRTSGIGTNGRRKKSKRKKKGKTARKSPK